MRRRCGVAFPAPGGYVPGMKTTQESYVASLARIEAANEHQAATQFRWLAGIGLAVGSVLVGTIVGGFLVLSFMVQN